MANRQIDTNNYLEKLYKLIPVEVSGAYIAGSSIILSQNDARKLWPVLVGWGLALLIVNPFFLRFAQGVTNIRQNVLSTLSFPIWAANVSIAWVSGTTWALLLPLLLILWTLIIPIFPK